jgi:hypothetical protein
MKFGRMGWYITSIIPINKEYPNRDYYLHKDGRWIYGTMNENKEYSGYFNTRRYAIQVLKKYYPDAKVAK